MDLGVGHKHVKLRMKAKENKIQHTVSSLAVIVSVEYNFNKYLLAAYDNKSNLVEVATLTVGD